MHFLYFPTIKSIFPGFSQDFPMKKSLSIRVTVASLRIANGVPLGLVLGGACLGGAVGLTLVPAAARHESWWLMLVDDYKGLYKVGPPIYKLFYKPQ